jgi:ubiquinone/menaquinone biosynthesis C-methylase UbiE
MTERQPSADLQSLTAIFDRRAPEYDDSWHKDLANNMISWCTPQAGDCVLDLACGTGLVTYLAKKLVGLSGIVVGVDISTGMLDVAKTKEREMAAAIGSITWLHHNIDDDSLLEQEGIQRVGGFDIIYCCSAMPLIPDPRRALAWWSRLLRPGGRIIFDYPTEDTTVLGLLVDDVPRRLGLAVPFSWRAWMKGPKSLTDAVENAGFQVETVFKTRSYIPEKQFKAGDADKVFAQALATNHRRGALAKEGVREEARKVFAQKFERETERNGGIFRDGHWLYVVVGRKNAS